MKERSFDEMIAYFNRRVSQMDITQDYKMELLGMVTALGYKHEKTAQQWIPCGDRLPEVHKVEYFLGVYLQSEPVLVYGVPEYAESAPFFVATYCDDLDGTTYWSTEPDAETIDGVTAWMPLPEPYKGEETHD